MKRIFFFLSFLVSLSSMAQKVVSLTIDGAINPVAADFIHRGIELASTEKASCLLIHLNTPGGLLKSTRIIVGDILDSPVPVVVYVSPAGAHAGSAGVFITMAAHIAAMAPETNIGAAHPVNMQGQMDTVMSDKVTNDAAAFIRTIARKRNRNLEWAEEAVRKSFAITASEALEKNVIDLVAPNTSDLLSQIDGRKFEINTGTATLRTKGAELVEMNMSTAEKILNILSDPNIAYILLLMGIYGILFELYNPGSILPGIVGVISLVLAFYSMHTLPINYAGLALIIFGIILFLLEIKIISHGMLAIGGVVSLTLGSLMLIRTGSNWEIVRISKSVIFFSVGLSALFFMFVIGFGLKAQLLKPVTGLEGMIGEAGEVLETLDPGGRVRVHGEVWTAESIDGRIEAGEKIRVVSVRNLQLIVGR